MGNNFKETNESFQIFLEERSIPNPDEMLGKALRYLKNKGRSVSLKGFDENNVPIIEIDTSLYVFEKCFGIWESAKFTKIDNEFLELLSNTLFDRTSKIQSFYL